MPNEINLNLNEVNLNENSNLNPNPSLNLNLNEVNLNENSNKNDPRDSYRTMLDAFCDNYKESYLLDLYHSSRIIMTYKYTDYPDQAQLREIENILYENSNELLDNSNKIPFFIKDYRKVNEDNKQGKKYVPIQFYKASLQQLFVILSGNRNAVKKFTNYSHAIKNKFEEDLNSLKTSEKDFKKNMYFKHFILAKLTSNIKKNLKYIKKQMKKIKKFMKIL
jgi:hypothetical protein